MHKINVFLYTCIFFATCISTQENPDEITTLPGRLGKIGQYAGYITVDAKNERKLFYWFVEAQKDADSKPLVLWQTGGPGCSSLLGLLIETGPYTPSPYGETLYDNPWPWNIAANMLYVESPAGVGFSSSKVKSDYTVGDKRTATDLIQFLTEWLAKYPKYMNRPFYLAGESYGGHYIPNLALEITRVNLIIKFKGFLVGNPWTYPEFDNNGTTLFWFTHGLMTIEQYSAINEHCHFNQSGPFLAYPQIYKMDPICEKTLNQVDNVLQFINPYDIYGDSCMRMGGYEGYRLHQLLSRNKNPKNNFSDYPCGPKDISAYLNRPDVQKAIHADPTNPWEMCSSHLDYSIEDLLTPMRKVWEQLLPYHNELKFLVYSGDVDAAVPWLGTLLWIKDLEKDGIIKLETDWRPWNASTLQVGGFTLQYDKMTFKTVREAGHQVPSTQPRRAIDILQDFLDSK